VLEAVAGGDLSLTIESDKWTNAHRQQFRRTARAANAMVKRMRAVTSELTRVAAEVGTEGKLGGQARVPRVAGAWKDLTDSVNKMALNLTARVRDIAEVTTAVANGDLSKKITVDVQGEILEQKDTINQMVDQLNAFASEVTRVAREVGTEGRLGGQAHVPGASGTWKDLTDSVNQLAANLTSQVRNIADVTTAVARGDLSRKITVPVQGEILELKNTINLMVDQLNGFASEVTRVAREVGSEGQLGSQARVPGASGTWKDLTDSVNTMAANLTTQVRNIAEVTTAVAKGDLSEKITVDARGEIRELKNTINVMVDQLNAFASEVTRVAREVGTLCQLGGQASVPGVSGTWKDLTDNVNQLAAILTNQVRAIAEVTTAVTEGDLTRKIHVEAQGEVALLKDKINEMIRRLRETTAKSTEQDWLKTNLARFTRMLQGQRDVTTVSQLVMSELAPLMGAQYGTLYTTEVVDGEATRLIVRAAYAHTPDQQPTEFRFRHGLVGQCAAEQRRILLRDIPAGSIRVSSGLAELKPVDLVITPAVFEGQVKAVIELASVQHFSRIHLDFLDQLTESIGIVFHTIRANTRTEELLKQSQTLFAEAQEASRSKSAFLSMAAHELRTPLSVVIGYLSMLQDGTLTADQAREPIEMLVAKANELTKIVNDLLMAARVEAGTVPTEVTRVDLRETVEHAIARAAPRVTLLKGKVSFARPAQPIVVRADRDQLGRILDNLINNSLTYCEGSPRIAITVSDGPLPQVSVEDNGVGIPPDSRERIFERFFRIDHPELHPQSGTGLGLYLGKELAQRHGGSLTLERSAVGRGSTFVLRLPSAISEENGSVQGAVYVDLESGVAQVASNAIGS